MSKNKNLATENDYDTAISGKKTNKEVSKTEEVLPVFNNEVLDSSYQTNSSWLWFKQNKIGLGIVATVVIFLAGILILQSTRSNNSVLNQPTVTTFEECVYYGGRILENTNPRECYYRQQQFIEQKSNQTTTDTNLNNNQSDKPQEKPKEPESPIKKYTNPSYPTFELEYSKDWLFTEENTSTGTTLIFQKDGINLVYNIALIDTFGDMGGVCTNDTTRYLEIKNSKWFRVRLNDNQRMYIKDVQLSPGNAPVPEEFKDEITTEVLNQAKTSWVEVVPAPEGVFKACIPGLSYVSGIVKTNIDSVVGGGATKAGILKITISGISDKNQKTLQEADAIVASTKL